MSAADTGGEESGADRQASLIAALAERAAKIAADGGPKRIRLSRAKGWRLPDNAVVVARPTKWGNPFVVGQDGTRADCTALHALMLDGFLSITGTPTLDDQRDYRSHAQAHLDSLRGHDLACWCSLDGPCHADALLIAAATQAQAGGEG